MRFCNPELTKEWL